MKITYSLVLVILLLSACQPQKKYSRLEDFNSPGSLARLKEGKMIQASSYDTTGANNDRINIHEGKTATILKAEGPGIITRIWVTIDSRDPYFLRRIVLRMYWDEEENPSVEVPVGDFFGCGYEYRHYTSAFLGMSSGGYYCYFPMPFNKSARIEVVNETGQEIYAFYYHIDYFSLDYPFEEDVAYFHSQWNRDVRTDDSQNYTILDASGTGHFAGCNLHAEPYTKSLWYLEGDEMVYVDGEEKPSIHGTGTEDYFTSGWYYKTGEFSAAYHGLVMKDETTMRTVAYRHHIPDPIPFKKSLKFTIEHGHANEENIDLSSTAYWYQTEPHKAHNIPKSSLRIPLRAIVPNGCLEAEEMLFHSEDMTARPADMSDYGPEWSNNSHLHAKGIKGGSFTLRAKGLYEPLYDATVYFTRGPSYGKVVISGDEGEKGIFEAYSPEVYPGGSIIIKDLNVKEGEITLKFLVSGKNEASTGYDVGVDAIRLQPRRHYIPEWYILGPFPNERDSDILRYGLDTSYPPEMETDFYASYSGMNGQQIQWERFDTPANGYFSLWDKFNPYEFVVCYAVSYIYTHDAQTVPLLIGSDDGAKVFLNKTEKYRFLDVRIAAPDQDTIQLNLDKGWNELLLKIENNFGGYAFYARLIDKNGSLIFKPRRPD